MAPLHKAGKDKDRDIDIAVISSNFGNDPVEEGMNFLRIADRIDPRIEPVPIVFL